MELFENTQHSVRALGGAAVVTLALGVAAAVGVVPQLANGRATISVSEAALPSAITDTAVVTTTVPTTVAATSVVPVTVPAPTIKKSPVPRVVAAAPVPAATSTPALPTSTLAVRRQPTSAEVDQAIQGLRRYVLLFVASPAQVIQAGDQVCTAFDQGKTFAEVKAMGMAAVAHVPLIGVSAGAADYVVRTGVTLFCPDYQSKLV